MFIERFIKKVFISFIPKKEGEFLVLKETIKNNTVIEKENKDLTLKELNKFIKDNALQTPQTYSSTLLLTINQGIMPTCNRQKFKEEGINIDNLKIICINNKYSFYTSLYEINYLQKEFIVDFIYSVFGIIDSFAKQRNNTLYILVLSNHLACLIYNKNIPLYANIIEIQKEEIENIDEIEDINELLDIEEDIVSLDEEIEEEPSNIENINIEKEVIEFLKISIKEYYENNVDFIEKIFILDTLNIKDINKLIEEEFLIENEIIEFDILKQINKLSRNYV
jgi:hypothetical protein